MKTLAGILAALTMVTAPAFAKTVPVGRAHKPRVATRDHELTALTMRKLRERQSGQRRPRLSNNQMSK